MVSSRPYRSFFRRMDNFVFIKKVMSLFWIFILIFWMMAAFGKGQETTWQWAWFHVTQESINHGLTIAFRMLAFVTYGLLFPLQPT